MYEVRSRSFSSVQERPMNFQEKRNLSRCRCRVYRVFFVAQLYHHRIFHRRSLYMQRLNDLMKEQSKHKRKSGSASLELFDFPLTRLVIVERVQVFSAIQNVQVAENCEVSRCKA